jgi:hypothetical protein
MAASRKRQQEDPIPEAIAYRAYEISLSDSSGNPEENWLRAEQELRNPAPAPRRRSSPRAKSLGQPSAAT